MNASATENLAGENFKIRIHQKEQHAEIFIPVQTLEDGTQKALLGTVSHRGGGKYRFTLYRAIVDDGIFSVRVGRDHLDSFQQQTPSTRFSLKTLEREVEGHLALMRRFLEVPGNVAKLLEA